MEMQPQAPVSIDRDPDNLSEVRNGGVSGKIEAFNGLADGNSQNLQSNQSKHGEYGDLPASKISEFMKLGSLESASTHSLFSVVNRILDESIDRKNEDIPQRVASLLKLVVQEIEQRVSKHADYMRKQNNLYKSREDRYQSKIKALETLATGTTEENEVVVNQLQEVKLEKMKIEEKKKLEEQDLVNLRKEKDKCESQILSLKEELTLAKKDYKENYFQLEAKAEENQDNLHKKIMELERCLTDSSNKIQELEDLSESKYLRWKRKENKYENFIDSQFQALQELRAASESMKEEVLRTKNIYAEEFHNFGVNMKGLVDAVQNYHSVFEENRKLYNEVQDLKGNIRVYCRIKPFVPGKTEKQTTIQFIGEDGELVVTNPSKPGKDTQRLFKFNRVFGPVATQGFFLNF